MKAKVVQTLSIGLLSLMGNWSFAQLDSTSFPTSTNLQEEKIADEIENLAEENDNESDYSEIEENIAYYAEHKMNINQPDYEVLMSVFKLNDYQIYHLRRYLDEFGPLQTKYELAAIEGFTQEQIASILPYIVILPVNKHEKLRFKKIVKYGKNMLLMRYAQILEPQSAYVSESEALSLSNPNAVYQGSKQYCLLKYKFDYKSKIRFGFTAEKDAGEELFKGSNKPGFDFYSFHFFLKDFGWLKALAIGDYQVQFGQGLAMWIGYSSQTPTNSISTFHYAKSINPYTSSNENNYMRGCAGELQFKKIKCAFFYSYRSKDAGLSDTSDKEESYILSLQETGYHRTLAEIEKENSIHQHTAGVFGYYTKRVFRIGAGVFYAYMDKPLQRKLSPYNQFTCNKQGLLNASITYNAVLKKVSIFGENAISDNKGFALLNGLVFYADPLFTISLLHRYYSVNYQAIQPAAFGESSSTANETGLFFGFSAILNKYITWNAHVDYFRFMWLKYRVDAPSDGFAVFSQLTCNLHSRCMIYLRVKYTSKEINQSVAYYNQLTQTRKQNYRLHIKIDPIPSIQLKTCIEYVVFYANDSCEKQNGYLLYQDIRWKYKWLTVTGRYALFHTDSYDTRMYAYENDVLYASSIPAYYSKGNRFYLMIKADITSYVDVWLRISQTFYKDKQTIGSGPDEINNNTKTDIRMQLIVKF
ncbi:MAG: hypothetical protein PHC83_03710 [Bacteroidales bacterium]|nr:hypothetical protein [Bacteroidales bacterium]MDD4209711.1 hypothetical protein [Bacteroidales bacterium]